MPLVWAPPEEAFTLDLSGAPPGIPLILPVYHAYKNQDANRMREFGYTFDFAEDPSEEFDVRDLLNKMGEPVARSSDSTQHKQIIEEAVRRGVLVVDGSR